jgi:hypothetical protein
VVVIVFAVIVAQRILLLLIMICLGHSVALSHGVVAIFMYEAWTIEEILVCITVAALSAWLLD